MKLFCELAELISASTMLFKNYASYAKRKGFPTPPYPTSTYQLQVLQTNSCVFDLVFED